MDEKALAAAIASALAQYGGRANNGNVFGPNYRAVSSTPSTPYYTGPSSLFGVMGLERDIISTRIQPMGLADRLPVQLNTVMNPLFAYFTGFGAGSGSEPDGVCDDPPTPGSGQNCIQTAQFGRFSRQTRVFEINRLGQQINRGEFQDLSILNGPLVGGMGGITVPGIPNTVNNFLQEARMRMVELGVDFQQWFGRMLYEGNPANNTNGGGYREFPGLDILVSTGKVDALTNTACPSLDSDIKNFNYANVSTGGANVGTSLVNTLSYMMRYLRFKAEHSNMGAVNWVFVMRPAAFWELTASWPCAYMTYRCANNSDAAPLNLDAGDMVNMRDDMRNNNYLIIDGIRYPVILDTMIREETNTTNANVASGSFASDIYILPLTVRGGMASLYWEVFNQGVALELSNPGMGNLLNNYFWSDGGRYLWHFKPPTNWCVQWLAKVEPRLILRTPHLAGRLTNVAYSPLQHEPDAHSDDPYFVLGGESSARSMTTLHAEWGTVS